MEEGGVRFWVREAGKEKERREGKWELNGRYLVICMYVEWSMR
jgi:hypothetical protein